MSTIYANKIEREVGQIDAFTINDVPDRWKQQTLKILNSRGLNGYGQPLST